MITKFLATCAALMCLALAGTAQAQYYYYPTQTYPVYAQPAPPVVYNNAPVYYSQPVYAQPVYQQPVYATPVYAQPIYQQPVYGGYYSPLSIGLNFGFGGGGHRWR